MPFLAEKLFGVHLS